MRHAGAARNIAIRDCGMRGAGQPDARGWPPRIERIDGGDKIVVEADQILSGISLVSNAGARFETPETRT
jgi:hypothetical protein